MDRDVKTMSFERELCTFYEYCKENNFSPEQMKIICEPLRNLVLKTKLYRFVKFVFLTLPILVAVYYLFKSETVAWHLSAVARIAMIQALPLWNWQTLFAEKCLIRGTTAAATTQPEFDCTLCESIDGVSYERDVDPTDLNDLYLDVDRPVVVEDGLGDWPIMDGRSNVSEMILNDETLSNSRPCDLATNVLSAPRDVALSKVLTRSFRFKKWFVHFRNCEDDAVRAFRAIAPRPRFLPVQVSPIRYSWLLSSGYYNPPAYKPIRLSDKYAVVCQIVGSHRARLVPRRNCARSCPVVETVLSPGQALTFGSLWDLEYKPEGDEINVAIVLEAH